MGEIQNFMDALNVFDDSFLTGEEIDADLCEFVLADGLSFDDSKEYHFDSDTSHNEFPGG